MLDLGLVSSTDSHGSSATGAHSKAAKFLKMNSEINGSNNGQRRSSQTTYEPISGPPNDQNLTAQRTLSRSSSRAENPCAISLSDGYSRTGADDEGDIERSEQAAGPGQEPEFLVKWDDDNDPMDPRNMGLLRRWLIVAVISMGSACV